MDYLCVQKQLWECYGYNQLEIMDVKCICEVVVIDNYIGGMFDMSGGYIYLLNFVFGEVVVVELFGGRIYEQSLVICIECGVSLVVYIL